MPRTAKCFECGEEAEYTGRNTAYCPSCDVCPECGCPDADGFKHNAGCAAVCSDCDNEIGLDGYDGLCATCADEAEEQEAA